MPKKIPDLNSCSIMELGLIYFKLFGNLPIMEKNEIIIKIKSKLKDFEETLQGEK